MGAKRRRDGGSWGLIGGGWGELGDKRRRGWGLKGGGVGAKRRRCGG